MNYMDELYEERQAKANDELQDGSQTDHVGRVVEVYYNTHRGKLSVRDAKTKKVFAHTSVIYLEDVKFVVQPAGRDRVRRENKKNVHAWVRGTVCPIYKGYGYANLDSWLYGVIDSPMKGSSVKYNPYKYDSFVYTKNEQPINSVDGALVYAGGTIEVFHAPQLFRRDDRVDLAEVYNFRQEVNNG